MTGCKANSLCSGDTGYIVVGEGGHVFEQTHILIPLVFEVEIFVADKKYR